MFGRCRIIGILALVSFLWMNQYVQAQSEKNLIQVADKYGNMLKIIQEPITGSAHGVYGLKCDISRYGISNASLDQRNIGRTVQSILADYRDIIKIDSDNLMLKQAMQRKGKWYISCKQLYQGIPVYRTSVGFTIEDNGTIQRLGADVYPDVNVSTVPSISLQEAKKIAEGDFQTNEMENITLKRDISLIIYPKIAGTASTGDRASRFTCFDASKISMPIILFLFPISNTMSSETLLFTTSCLCSSNLI